jgi:hypothetical protein
VTAAETLPETEIGPRAKAAAPEPPRISRFKKLAPIVAIQLYLNASILIFAFGPWIWPMRDGTKLYVFVALAHLALLLGYLSGINRRPAGYHGRTPMDRLLRWSVWTTLLLYLPTLYWATQGQINIIEAIRDPGTVYYRFQDISAEVHETPLIGYVRMLFAPLLAMAMPLLARRWRGLSLRMRALGALAVASNLSLFVFTGRNKGLADFVLLLPWLLAMALHGSRVRLKRLVLPAVLFAAALTGFAAFFITGSNGRTGGADDAFEKVQIFGGLQADLDNPLLRALPRPVQGPVMLLSFTQTHGYLALSWALDKPWVPSWGVGHSYFLYIAERRLTGREDLQSRSYPARLQAEDGWDMIMFWHTIYTWLASDLSFPGTLVAVFLLGRLFALTWLDSLRGENPYAVGLLILLVTMFYYFPANNIILGQPEGFAGFWGLFGLWFFTRRRVRFRAPEPGWEMEPAPVR